LKKAILTACILCSALFTGAPAQSADLTLQISASKTTISVGETVDFGVTVLGGFSSYSYEWDFDDVESYKNPITSQNPSHTFNWLGTHYVWVRVTDSSSEATGAQVIVEVKMSSDETVKDVTNATDVGESNVLDNTGTSDCVPKLANIISTYRDSTNGLHLYFPAGTYRFDFADMVSNKIGIEISRQLYHKITLSGDGPSQTVFVGYKDVGEVSGGFVDERGHESGNNIMLIRGIHFRMEYPVSSYDYHNTFIQDFEQTRHTTVEDCKIENFDQEIYRGNYMINRRNTITGCGGDQNKLAGNAASVRYDSN
jgi:hypothetical protein